MKKQTKTEKIKLLSTNHKDWFLNRSTSNKNHKTPKMQSRTFELGTSSKRSPPPIYWQNKIIESYYYITIISDPENLVAWTTWNEVGIIQHGKNDFSYREKARTKLKNICSLQLQRRWRIWRRDKPVTTRTTAIELGTHTTITWLNIKEKTRTYLDK